MVGIPVPFFHCPFNPYDFFIAQAFPLRVDFVIVTVQ